MILRKTTLTSSPGRQSAWASRHYSGTRGGLAGLYRAGDTVLSEEAWCRSVATARWEPASCGKAVVLWLVYRIILPNRTATA